MYQVCLYREGAMGKISYDLVFPIIIKSLDLVIIFVPVILVLDPYRWEPLKEIWNNNNTGNRHELDYQKY
jgi:hypothetical protein